MRTLTILAVAAIVALAAGCKSSTVENKRGGKLTLIKPGDVTIAQGETAEVKITIKRDNLEGPVSISFEKLPAGVTVADGDKKIVGEEGTYSLKAGESADLVSGHQAQVTAKGPGGIAVTEFLKIAVKAKGSPPAAAPAG